MGFRRPGGGLLLGGFVAYGVATFSSLPANLLFGYYPRMGRFVMDRLFAGRMIPIELLGAVLFLAGVLALSGHLVNRMADAASDESAPDKAIRPRR